MERIYLCEAFGWCTQSEAQVAISQLRTIAPAQFAFTCPGAQLNKYFVYYASLNVFKILGYIPVVNVILGIAAIIYGVAYERIEVIHAETHSAKWLLRGILMIVTGPLLFIIDFIKMLQNRALASTYSNPELRRNINTDHNHTIECIGQTPRCI